MRARLLLPALVVATCAHGRLRQMTILPIAQPPIAAQAWDAMAACSRVAEQPGGALSDVHWFVADLLAADRFRYNHRVRFHAFQGLYLFVAWLIVDQVLRPLFNSFPYGGMRLDKVLEAVLMVAWIVMLVKASHDETYSLPIIGDLAQKSASER